MATGSSGLSTAQLRIDGPDTLGLEGERALDNVLAGIHGAPTQMRVGRYEIGARLGAGACGAVYDARDPSLDRRVAVKVVLPRTTGAGAVAAQARLLREARALAKLGHPNVVEIFDVGVDQRPGRSDRVYIVMELVAGVTLDAWVAQAQRSTSDIVSAYVAAARALAAAHSVGVVHRDFKPSNVMMGDDGRVRVLDFGLAREDLRIASTESQSGERPGDDAGGATSGDSLTQTGVVLGTPRFMAPEQHAAQPATPQSDQYALCVSLWQAAVGRPPFSEATMIALGEAKEGGPPPRPATMPAALYAVLRRGLMVDPNARWPDLDALADALQGRRTRRWTWVAGLGVAAALVVGAVAMAAGGTASEAPEPLAGCEATTPVDPARFDAVVAELEQVHGLATDGSDPARVGLRLHRFAEDFARARETVCAGAVTPERRAQAECLQRGRARFDALVAGGGELSGRSRVRRLLSLAVPSRCLDEHPDRVHARTEAEEVELDELYGIPAAMKGRPEAELEAALAEGERRGRELGDHHVAWYLALNRARPMVRRGANAEAAKLSRAATWEAAAAGDDLLASESLGSMLTSLAESDAPPEDLEAAFARADEILERAGHPAVGTVATASVRAMWSQLRGDDEGAAAQAELAEKAAGWPPVPGSERFLALALVGSVGPDLHLGALNVAARKLDRASALVEGTAWGPTLTAAIEQTRGEIADRRGDLDGMLRAAKAQHIATRKVVADGHPARLFSDAQLGRALVIAGEATKGTALIDAAFRRMSDFDGDLSHRLGFVAEAGVLASLATGDGDAAVAYAEALVELAAVDPADGFEVDHAYGLLGAAHVLAGDEAAARKALARAPVETFAVVRLARARLALAAGDAPGAAAETLGVLADLSDDDLSIGANSERADAYELLAELARRDGRTDDAAMYEVMMRERMTRADAAHRRRAQVDAGAI